MGLSLHGFCVSCLCRCRAEASLANLSTKAGVPLPSLLESLHTHLIQDFGPRAAQIMQIEHAPQLKTELAGLVRDMQKQLEPMLDAADSLMQLRSKGGRGNITMGSIIGPLTGLEACWMLGSLFKSLVLLHNSMLTVGKPQEAEPLWDAIMLVCEVVCPGSNTDIVLATNGAYRAGPPHLPFQEVQAAQQGLTRGLYARYGQHVAEDPLCRGRLREGVVAVQELVLSGSNLDLQSALM